MIRLSRLSDYGIVLMSHLAGFGDGDPHNAREIAAEARLPQPVVSKLLKALAREGLLTGQLVYALVNMTPSCASESRCGVARCMAGWPMQPIFRPSMLSAWMKRMLGRSGIGSSYWLIGYCQS